LYLSSDDLEENSLFLVLADASSLNKMHYEIVSDLVERGFTTVVCTSNQPSSILKKRYLKKSIDISNVYFIDTITSYALGRMPDDAERCHFVSTPGNLTDLGIAINETLRDIKSDQVCLVFDSISTTLIYVSSANISRFLHFLSNKLRIMDIHGMFMAVETGLDPGLMTQLTTFVDDVVREE